ncbi:tegument serine-threonine protein kinase [macacine betaherpesvirus 9]|uniref:Tegument serine-threonine protein kinase n=1 Tax=macacine betaherpesvirus 9 TaxID=2560568 RepID=A0A191S3T6_9BETA|nr:tegument serine-threonine protein kinase [macacine betaherpesvirus 9]ANC96538.1 tegument serine-threonine protein kinase [macacine betaherpesvirus 9]
MDEFTKTPKQACSKQIESKNVKTKRKFTQSSSKPLKKFLKEMDDNLSEPIINEPMETDIQPESSIELTCNESLTESPKSSNKDLLFLKTKEIVLTINGKSISDLNCHQSVLSNIGVFETISAPYLFPVHFDAHSFSIVYVPHKENLCSKFCDPEKNMARILGSGAYGKVYDLNNVAIKVSDEPESCISSYVSGVVRSKAGAQLNSYDCVFKNLLVSNSVCLNHKISLSKTYAMDLYKFTDWEIANVRNYYTIFCNLAEAVRFLNMTCRINHCDISLANILIQHNKGLILEAVLADYSLAEVHPEYNEKCGILRQFDNRIQIVPKSYNKLCDMYNPGFRPMVAHKIILADIYAEFEGKNNPVRHCNLDLCALSQVFLLCVMRMLDERGCREAQKYYENRLFTYSNEACLINPIKDPLDYKDACCKVLAEHVVLFGILFYRDVVDVFETFYDFLDANSEISLRDLFEDTYVNDTKAARRQPIRRRHAQLQTHEFGRRLLNDLQQLLSITTIPDLEKDPYSVFCL